MSNLTDQALLRKYAEERCEASFKALIDRHIGLVYSAALRGLGDNGSFADDIVQSAFCELARKAQVLCEHPCISGWLYTKSWNAASNFRRSQARRIMREKEAQMRQEDSMDTRVEGGETWKQMSPIIDELIAKLNHLDRMVLVMRFFEGKSLQEVARSLGRNENAIRMRADRALTKLRLMLSRRGIKSSSAVLSFALTHACLNAAPQGLPGTILTAALSTKTSGFISLTSMLEIIIMSKTKTLGIVALVVLAGGLPMWKLQSQKAESALELARKDDEIAQLQTRLKDNAVKVHSVPRQALKVAAADSKPTPLPASSGDIWSTFAQASAFKAQLRLQRLKGRLSLNADQEQKFDQIASQGKWDIGVREKLRALLSDPQKIVFDDLVKTETGLEARLVAVQSLNKLQKLAGLDQGAQDSAYTMLYDFHYNRLMAGEQSRSLIPQALMDSLGTIVTPEQMESIRRSGAQFSEPSESAYLESALSLSPDQAKEARRLEAEKNAILQRLIAGDPTLAPEQVNRSTEEYKQHIRALLTPEQVSNWDKYQAADQEGNFRSAALSELIHMQEAVALTSEQQDQLYDNLYRHFQEAGTMNAQVLVASTPEEFESKIKPILEKTKSLESRKLATIRSILSPEQYANYQSLESSQALGSKIRFGR